MMRILRVVVPIIFALVAVAPVRAAVSSPTAPRLEFRINPLVDLHFWLRALAAQGDAAAIPDGFAEAVAEVRALSQVFGGTQTWGLIEVPLAEVRGRAAPGALNLLPETFQTFENPPRSLPLRQLGRRLMTALHRVEARFRSDLWPERRQRLEAARRAALGALRPSETRVRAYTLESLGMAEPGNSIPVYLVFEMPPPGGATLRRLGGSGVCFVARSGKSESEFFETIWHEAIHALDVDTVAMYRDGNVLQGLRRQLAAGAAPAASRDIWHSVVFVQAAETVRRFVDPAHHDYGDTAGYYDRVPVARQVRAIWLSHLRGEITREQAVEQLVALTK